MIKVSIRYRHRGSARRRQGPQLSEQIEHERLAVRSEIEREDRAFARVDGQRFRVGWRGGTRRTHDGQGQHTGSGESRHRPVA